MGYFSKEEQKAMIEQFREFDAQMIHEKYLETVNELSIYPNLGLKLSSKPLYYVWNWIST